MTNFRGIERGSRLLGHTQRIIFDHEQRCSDFGHSRDTAFLQSEKNTPANTCAKVIDFQAQSGLDCDPYGIIERSNTEAL